MSLIVPGQPEKYAKLYAVAETISDKVAMELRPLKTRHEGVKAWKYDRYILVREKEELCEDSIDWGLCGLIVKDIQIPLIVHFNCSENVPHRGLRNFKGEYKGPWAFLDAQRWYDVWYEQRVESIGDCSGPSQDEAEDEVAYRKKEIAKAFRGGFDDLVETANIMSPNFAKAINKRLWGKPSRFAYCVTDWDSETEQDSQDPE